MRTATMFRSGQPIDLDQLRARVPSIFAEKPKDGVSSKYTFIPTTAIIELLDKQGWKPFAAGQGRAKSEDGRPFMKHVVRFRRESEKAKQLLKVGDSIPELVLTNSHNASSSYSFLMGLFRLVCTNGLTVNSGEIADYRIRHTGFKTEDVIAASGKIIEQIPALVALVDSMRTTKLSPELRVKFAEEAMALRWDAGKAPIKAADLLTGRRPEDSNPDLWSTLNVVQENMIRGGIEGRSLGRTQRRYVTRAVNSPAGDIRLNRGIWQLAEKIQKIA